MKTIYLFFLSLFFISTCIAQKNNSELSPEAKKQKISTFLDSWHNAAAMADFDSYFGKMSPDAIYIGTDATENWNLNEFKAFSKPYFDRGAAWDFDATERNIYISESEEIAWFDEILQSHMGPIRGSGVLVKNNGNWKIKHYVLSFTVPNEVADKVTEIVKKQ